MLKIAAINATTHKMMVYLYLFEIILSTNIAQNRTIAETRTPIKGTFSSGILISYSPINTCFFVPGNDPEEMCVFNFMDSVLLFISTRFLLLRLEDLVIGLVSSTTSSADSISDSIDFGMIYYDSFTVLFSFRSAASVQL